jgi:hypothetical protein
VWHCGQDWQLSQDAVCGASGWQGNALTASPGGVPRCAKGRLTALVCRSATAGSGPATPAQAQTRIGSRANSRRQKQKRRVIAIKVNSL